VAQGLLASQAGRLLDVRNLAREISRAVNWRARFAWARGGVGTKTEHVERSIRELIASGELGPDGRLPSERQLAEQLSAGRTTIRLVLMKLATEGMIRSEHGRGYFVTAESQAAE
jgi:DNA-binding GntR family transcriptional regulator